MTPDTLFDIAIIGGGVNGTGIARDAAGRGLSVALFEQRDLASGTSSASTKLIHGGLRYLEYYEFRLVREALMEREVLLKLAPHIIWPLRFVLPHQKGLRPRWLIRLGLFLYDHLGGRKILPATKDIDLRKDEAGKPLKPGYAAAFEYSDCWVEDSRLVVLNARAAADMGAVIETRTTVTSAAREGDHWQVTTTGEDGASKTIAARILINAAGPWVGSVFGAVIRANAPASVRMVQGSHIVVPRIFEHDRAYIFQNADNRIIFAIPYERDFTLIGTTDRDWHDDPAKVAASEEEITYLCAAASEYFAKPVTRQDVVWTYSGVRPLYDDGASKAQEATRDYVLEVEAPAGAAPLLSVFGGKITTSRRLAEHALEKLAAHLPASANSKAGWTAGGSLPGGDFAQDGFEALLAEITKAYPFVPAPTLRRYIRAYGTKTRELLNGAQSLADLGHGFGADLYEREVAYLMAQEWARSAEDILWRRSKLGLRLSTAEAQTLNDWITLKKSHPNKR